MQARLKQAEDRLTHALKHNSTQISTVTSLNQTVTAYVLLERSVLCVLMQSSLSYLVCSAVTLVKTALVPVVPVFY